MGACRCGIVVGMLRHDRSAAAGETSVDGVDLAAWRAGFEDLFALVAGRFGRVEPRRRARAYVLGLLAPLERKNGWSLAEAVGLSGPGGMQRLLNFYQWDADGMRDDLRDYVVEHLGHWEGVLIADDTGFVKKGTRSAGVARQYSGTAGRIENCQIGTFLAYASPHGRALVDRELYLPRSWTDDPDRCRAAGIGDEVAFATKPAQAQTMLARALAAGVPFRYFTADEAYGQVKGLRVWLETRDVFHVLATKRNDTVVTDGLVDARVDGLIAALPTRAWQRASAGDGAHGPRVYDWARIPIRPMHAPDRGHWVLARRSITDPAELAYYICYAPAGTTLDELIAVAGSRWAIEECFQTGKTDVGLDQYQVRTYPAWYRHITLAMAAQAFLAALAAGQTPPAADENAATGKKGPPTLWTTT